MQHHRNRRHWDGIVIVTDFVQFLSILVFFSIFFLSFFFFFEQTLSRSLFNAFNFFLVSSNDPWGLYWTYFFTYVLWLPWLFEDGEFNLLRRPLFSAFSPCSCPWILLSSLLLQWGSGWCSHSRLLACLFSIFPPFLCVFPWRGHSANERQGLSSDSVCLTCMALMASSLTQTVGRGGEGGRKVFSQIQPYINQMHPLTWQRGRAEICTSASLRLLHVLHPLLSSPLL